MVASADRLVVLRETVPIGREGATARRAEESVRPMFLGRTQWEVGKALPICVGTVRLVVAVRNVDSVPAALVPAALMV
ncbi:MAG TPA: hypothetical protein VGY55_05200 [Pirellulales bacterium]|jgi:hypothetical protein|nr:hypothetical protein [Pirellulales bacterium]